MEIRKFRFKKEFFIIDGIHNIPAFIINSGHGYAFETYCCKNCGEIFVIELELLFHRKISLESLVNNKICPICSENLNTNLVNYPENIFYENRILRNNNKIDRSRFEKTEILEVYLLK